MNLAMYEILQQRIARSNISFKPSDGLSGEKAHLDKFTTITLEEVSKGGKP